jgi:hypothetical protein
MNVFGERYVPVGSVEAPDGELIDAIDSFHARPVALLARGAAPGAGRDELVARTRALMSLPPHPNISTVRDAFFAGRCPASWLGRRHRGAPAGMALCRPAHRRGDVSAH